MDKEDHYLGVMLDQAGAKAPEVRPRWDLHKLFVTAVGLIVGVFFLIYLADHLGLKLDILAWIAACCVVGAYMILRVAIGRQRVDQLLDRLLSFFDRPK